MNNSCLLIPIDPKTLSEKELSLLERETVNLGEALYNIGNLEDAPDLLGSDSSSDEIGAAASEENDNSRRGSLW
jgi:hypothetical protein